MHVQVCITVLFYVNVEFYVTVKVDAVVHMEISRKFLRST